MPIRAITILAAAVLGLGTVAVSDSEARPRNAPSAASAKGVAKTPAVKNSVAANRRRPPGRIASNGTRLDGLRIGLAANTVDAIVLPAGTTVSMH